ncbi:MAG TPA: cytochrome C oxidase subunit IV family protein [Anaeromyxobacter sp.]|nr:cytochrome C oxidase subunit IV family protein [Anaeromyxobacter sp.]
MAESAAHEEHPAGFHSHLVRYLVVWGGLLALTILTYTLARIHLPGTWAIAVALLIAVAKGSLVVLFFMHLWDERGANRVVFGTSLVFVALLIGLIIADNATRFPLANPPGSVAGSLPLGGADRDPPPATEQSEEP